MSPSKLDKYLNVLEALVDRPLKIEQIARRTNMEPQVLKHHLVFLVANGVAEERKFEGKHVAYAITERGFAVFKTLRALKYLEKLRDSLPIIEEAREIASVLMEQKYSRPKKAH